MLEHFSIFTKNFKRNQKLKKEAINERKQPAFIEKRKISKEEKIACDLGVDYYSSYSLPKAYVNNDNAFFAYSGLIYLYPPNDGKALLPFRFYKDRDLIISNTKAYSEIENLDEILLQMVNIYDKAIDKKLSINPYAFMLKLDDEITPGYKGKATLVMTDRTIPEKGHLHKYFLNRFLDHFIGWNFGVSVNRSEELKEALHKLNNKAIDKGLREDAGPGYGVYGLETEVYNGLQHYSLPTSKENVYKKRK